MTLRLTINGEAIDDIDSFYKEINRIFMSEENWKLGNSLDALDDLLYGGFGALKDAANVEIEWLNSNKSKAALGYNVTKAYYLQKLEPGSPFNKDLFKEKLAALENGTGETYFDLIINVINDHANVKLILS